MQEIIQSIVFIAAAILHGITGMGFPMLGTTALAFIMPLSKVVALVALPSLLMSLLVLCSNNKKGFYQEIVYYLKTYKLLAIGSVVGSILGGQAAFDTSSVLAVFTDGSHYIVLFCQWYFKCMCKSKKYSSGCQ